jgi:sigma-B regulation protein RsbU (phosphoserine phosphatase)
LENARLYESLRVDEDRFQKDLDAAREIQKQLLPKQTPWLPGVQLGVAYEPARHLGGDFYDFRSYGDHKLSLAVGDVAGKSTPAALYGTLALGMLREASGQNLVDPRTLLADMNCKLKNLSIGNRFLALAFAVFDNRTHSLVMANSGLPHPYLIRDGKVKEILVEGIPLGIFDNRQYEQVRLELQAGDTVVICSDGIEESLNQHDEEFGRKQIRATLARLADNTASEIASGLRDAVTHHAGAIGPSDDRTILALQVTS